MLEGVPSVFALEKLERLRAFGLTTYGARAYLALLELGTSEARGVSRLAKVPLAKVYSTLDQLHERGLVGIDPGPPKRYTPEAFDVFLERLKRRHSDEIARLDASRRELASLFAVRGDVDVDDRGRVQTFRGRRNVLEKFRELTEKASSESIEIASGGTHWRIEGIASRLALAHARGVQSRLLVPADREHASQLARLAMHAQLRTRPSAGDGNPVHIAIFDHERALLAHFVPDDSSLQRGMDVCVYIDEGAIVRALAALVECEWARGQPLPTVGPRTGGLPHLQPPAWSGDGYDDVLMASRRVGEGA